MTTEAEFDDRYVASRVRYELKDQRRSARELAREIGMTSQAMHRRLKGDVPFSAVDLAHVAEILELPITVFFPPREAAS